MLERADELALGVPERLRALIEHRIDALGQGEQRLLAVAAAAGEEWSAALVAAALDLECVAADECCEALAGQGQMIAQAGITEWPDGTVAGRYRFLHALYQEVLYQRLAAAQRVRLHKCLGECLAAAYGEDSHRVAAELAEHFEQGCDYPRALRYLGQAAENAGRRYANHEAVAYLSRALALVDRLPPSEQVQARIDLLQRRGHVRSVMDDLDSAIADLKLVLRAARERNDPELVVKTLVQICRLARWFDSHYCLETAAEAETVSREINDDLIKACARVNYARLKLHFAMLNVTGWRQDSVATCRNGLAVIRKARDPAVLVPFLANGGWMECMSSNYELARLLAEEGARTAQEVGDSFHYMICRWMQSWTMIYLGRLGEMRRGVTLALSVAEKNGNHAWIMNYRLALARLHEELLDFDGARVHCDHALEICRERRPHLFTVHTYILLGRAFLGLQDNARAYEHLSEAARLSEDAMGIADWHMHLPLNQSFGDYWLAQDDLTQAREMATKLCASAALPPERTYLAFGHRLLAEIAIVERQWDHAEEDLAQAMSAMNGPPTPSAVWQAYGIAPPECSSPGASSALPLVAWRVYATAAKLCELQGRRSEAEAFRQQSRAVIQQLADPLDASDPLRESLLAGHERIVHSTA